MAGGGRTQTPERQQLLASINSYFSAPNYFLFPQKPSEAPAADQLWHFKEMLLELRAGGPSTLRTGGTVHADCLLSCLRSAGREGTETTATEQLQAGRPAQVWAWSPEPPCTGGRRGGQICFSLPSSLPWGT